MAFADKNYLAVFDGAQTRNGTIKVKKAVWMGFTAAGDDLVITDADGHDWCTLKAVAANGKLEVPQLEGMYVTDLEVSTIDAGKLYVSYE